VYDVIPALKRLKKVDFQFEASLIHIVISSPIQATE
jgi:hypothetical protein